jgi:leucyl-tRNA synthetase
LRDWLISRQRYWGAPIPMIHCKKCGIVPVPEKELPVLLPENVDFKPTGESPLKYNEEFVHTTCPRCKSPAERETDTLDGFLCSCWYMLRYTSPQEQGAAFDREKVQNWLPVDFYTGGAEHAVMHLLYTRFFTKAIRDIGIVDFGEPFLKLFNQGIIIHNHQRMSKSRGNVVNPDEYVAELGVDTVRAYMMFIAPWEQGGEWDDSGIAGINRWLNRLWNLSVEEYMPFGNSRQGDNDLVRMTHQTIKRVTEDLDKIRLNTMVAALMEMTNYLGRVKETANVTEEVWDFSLRSLLLLLAPTAPHLAEELWRITGNKYSIHNHSWPNWDEAQVTSDYFTLVVQVNGKVRDRLKTLVSVTEEEAVKLAKNMEKVKPFLEGKEVVKAIYVPGKLVNIVVK